MAKANRTESPIEVDKAEVKQAPPALRAAIYCRKSNDDRKGSDEVSMSVKAQELDCKRVIEREGWTLTAIYADDGISGRTWAVGKDYDALAEADTLTRDYVQKMSKKRRPGLGALLDSVGRREIDIIVVRDMPRLARPVFQSTLANYLPSFIQSNKVRIYSLADGMIDYTDFGKSLALFLADALLDKELKTRAKHSKEAKKREWGKGRYIATHIPFGYMRDKDKKLVQHPTNAAIMKRFFEQCVKGVPTATMVKEFNASGKRSPRGKDLHPHTLRTMLQNPIYCGKMNADGRLIKCIDIDEPIISEQVHYKIVKQYESRKRIGSNRAKTCGGLASGIVRCGLCGYALSHWHSTDGPNFNRYICTMYHTTGCKSAIKAENLDEFLNYFTPLQSIMEQRQIIMDAENKKQLPELREREKQLNATIDKYMDKIESEDIDVFADVFKRLKTELRKVQERIIDLENIPEMPVKKEMREFYFNEFDESDRLTKEQKRDAVRSVFKKIVVFPNKVTCILVSDETFTVKRLNLGRRRIWIPPADWKIFKTGESLTIDLTHAIDEPMTFLDGKLKLVRHHEHEASDPEAEGGVMWNVNMKAKMKKMENRYGIPPNNPDAVIDEDDGAEDMEPAVYRFINGEAVRIK